MKKKIIIQITNNNRNYSPEFHGKCMGYDLPLTTQTYEGIATIFNNAKLTKSIIKNTLRAGENNIEGVFRLVIKSNKLNGAGIKFTKSAGCFKIDIIAILEFTDDDSN
jgi:hypothetical protein